LISTLSIRFYSEPRLAIGTFVDQDLRSPRTITATDIEATKQAKELAKQQVTPIYRSSPEIDTNAIKHLEELLQVGDNLRISSGNLPYVDRKILSDDVQRYLRRISNLDWSQLQDRANKLAANVNNQAAIASFINRDKEAPSVALAELTLYKINALPQDYQKLINTVTDIRKAYALTQQKAAKGPEMFRDRLLEMTNEEWEACKKLTRQALIDVQSTGIVAGLPDDMLQKRLTNLSNLPHLRLVI